MSEFVLVGCRLPWGVVIDIRDPATGAIVEAHTLHGYRLPRNAQGFPILGAFERVNERGPEEHAAGVTRVPAAFWAAWLSENKGYQPVRQGLIFAANDMPSLAAMCNELKTVPNGLEALDPFKPGAGLTPEDSKVGTYQKSALTRAA